jgi:hypothetical protein
MDCALIDDKVEDASCAIIPTYFSQFSLADCARFRIWFEKPKRLGARIKARGSTVISSLNPQRKFSRRF